MGQVLAFRQQPRGYVGVADAASWFGVSRRTIERWLASGCPSTRVGGRRMVQIDLIEAWGRKQGLIQDRGSV